MTPDLITRYDQRVPRYTSYPTAPQFSNRITPALYESWLKELDPDVTLSLYVHIPFCAELCWYCGCHTAVSRGYAPIEHYVSYLKREISLISDNFPKKMKVSHMHWGGGTPTALNPSDLLSLLTFTQERFHFLPDAEIAIEIDPRVLTENHVEALAKGGLTRASLGIQDFDPKVQEAINRIQPLEVTRQVVQWLRDYGIKQLSFDLMYGLPFQTVDNIHESIKKALEFHPNRIALFGYAHVPWMKKHQNLLPQDKLPNTLERVRQMEAATQLLEEQGYVAIGIDHFARPDDSMVLLQQNNRLRRNFQGYTTDETSTLIGFGASAIGSLPQGYVQNFPATAHYRDAVLAGTPATARGIAITQEDLLRRSIIERLMCDFFVDLDYETAAFNMTDIVFDTEFQQIDTLAKDGIIIRDGRKLTIPREARPLVRLVCAVFDQYFAAKEGKYSKAL